MELVSTHLPKTGGASFFESLKEFYGDDIIKISNLEIENDEIKNLAKFRCVHGHFLPGKFISHYNESKFVTWMRDPVDRVISQYFYWKRIKNANNNITKENWTLKEFCMRPNLQNLYSQYLHNFPLERFDFIGILEHYDEDLKCFADEFLAGFKSHKYHHHETPDKKDSYFTKSVREKIESYHSKDMVLYEKALKMREER